MAVRAPLRCKQMADLRLASHQSLPPSNKKSSIRNQNAQSGSRQEKNRTGAAGEGKGAAAEEGGLMAWGPAPMWEGGGFGVWVSKKISARTAIFYSLGTWLFERDAGVVEGDTRWRRWMNSIVRRASPIPA